MSAGTLDFIFHVIVFTGVVLDFLWHLWERTQRIRGRK